jgi:hypothetical protein
VTTRRSNLWVKRRISEMDFLIVPDAAAIGTWNRTTALIADISL